MSDEVPAGELPSKQIRSSTFWIGLSFLLSTVLLVWSFTLPFRQSDGLIHALGDAEDLVPVSATEVVHHRQLQADEFLKAAKALDAELMHLVQEKNRTEEKPGIVQSRRNWDRHVESVERQLKQLGKPEKGTLEWRYQQELLEATDDGPME